MDIKNEITLLINKIDSRKAHVYAPCTYNDSGDLKKILSLLDEIDDVTYKITILYTVGNSYRSMARFYDSEKALLSAIKIAKTHNIKNLSLMKHIKALIVDRKRFNDDKCLDIYDLCSGLLSEDEISLLKSEIKEMEVTKHDQVELTEKYLSVIDEVEKRLDVIDFNVMGGYYTYCDLKREYLKEYGISWISPIELNPNKHFE